MTSYKQWRRVRVIEGSEIWQRMGKLKLTFECKLDISSKSLIVRDPDSHSNSITIPINDNLENMLTMSGMTIAIDWTPAEDGIHEYQSKTEAKKNGTYTISVRPIGQTTKYPHVNFDYNPKTGDITYDHYSLSKRKKLGGMREVVQTAIAYLKVKGVL